MYLNVNSWILFESEIKFKYGLKKNIILEGVKSRLHYQFHFLEGKKFLRLNKKLIYIGFLNKKNKLVLSIKNINNFLLVDMICSNFNIKTTKKRTKNYVFLKDHNYRFILSIQGFPTLKFSNPLYRVLHSSFFY